MLTVDDVTKGSRTCFPHWHALQREESCDTLVLGIENSCSRNTTREKPSHSAGKRATNKALQLKLSSSVDWHALLIYLLSSSPFHANRYC